MGEGLKRAFKAAKASRKYRPDRIQVCSLGLGQTTEQGAYWAKVDGVNVGENGRSHWNTYSEAYACGARFIMRESAADASPKPPT